MFGFIKDLAEGAGAVVGAVVGIAVTPLAVALGVSEAMIRRAIKAGCKTESEIAEWVRRNT